MSAGVRRRGQGTGGHRVAIIVNLKRIKPLNQKIEDLEKENGDLKDQLKPAHVHDKAARFQVEKEDSTKGIL